jgi:ABC-2 type transport system permease protein
MESTNTLRTLNERGWRMGFANLFHETNASWWRTKKWLIQTVIWLFFLNGMFAMFLWKAPAETVSETVAAFDSFKSMEAVQQNPVASAFVVFLVFSALMLPVAAIIAGQDAIISERQSGTAAWVLSKPVSRPAFILAKVAAGVIGILITGVVIQGVVAYIQLSLRIGSPWPIAGFLGVMGMIFLNLLFYLTLTYMLGSICTSRGPVLGISLSMALIGPVLFRSLPIIKEFTPWTLFMPVTEEVPPGLALALGQPLASVAPIIGTILMCLVFIAVALLRFQREEF